MAEPPTEFVARWPLRRGEYVGVAEDALVIVGADGQPVRAELDAVAEVTYRAVDYFVGILSIVLVGFGLWMTQESVAGGVVFALAGVVSVYLTYRKRHEVKIRVRGKSTPLTVYPEDAATFFDELEEYLDADVHRSEK